MNIAFICGSLEPGKDGVGDYVRRLSSYLAMHNHDISIISVNDRHTKSVINEREVVDNKQITVIRLPLSLKWSERLVIVKEEVFKLKPTWISLQYVPYSFNKWGVPIMFGSWLKQISSDAKWHIMVHEPYLGDKQYALKMRAVKYAQKIALKLLCKLIRPSVIHTSIPRYKFLLEHIGIKSDILGLFGNIPIDQVSIGSKDNINKDLKAVYFGTAPALPNQVIFANAIRNFSVEHKKKIHLILAGRLGGLGEKFVETIRNFCGPEHCEIEVLGEQSETALSQLLLTADVGIARVPPVFFGKSGTVISMLEHGLPIWVVFGNDQKIENYINFRPELCSHDLNDLLKTDKRLATVSRLPTIAQQMISGLANSEMIN